MFDLRFTFDDLDRDNVEAHALDAGIIFVTSLPEAFAGTTQASALGRVDASERRGPGTLAARAYLDDDDDSALAGDDVDLEVPETQVGGHDRVAALLEPERDEPFSP